MIELNYKLNHRYLKDPLWYTAFSIAVIFWFLFDYFVQEATPRNLFNFFQILLISVLLYPVLEEIVFRGVIQTKLLSYKCFAQRYFGISNANIGTSILFSLAHLFQHNSLAALFVFAPSIIFGYFRDRHDSVYPAVYLHVFYNAGFLSLFAT